MEQSQTNGNIKINGEEVTVFAAEIATDAEVTEMLNEVFGTTTNTPEIPNTPEESA